MIAETAHTHIYHTVCTAFTLSFQILLRNNLKFISTLCSIASNTIANIRASAVELEAKKLFQ